MATNEQVIKSFLNKKPSKAGRLTTDGHRLYSYSLEIARWIGDRPIVFDYTTTGGAFMSMTTSQHVGRAKREVSPDNVWNVTIAQKANLIK